jgi:hypothetical protein
MVRDAFAQHKRHVHSFVRVFPKRFRLVRFFFPLRSPTVLCPGKNDDGPSIYGAWKVLEPQMELRQTRCIKHVTLRAPHVPPRGRVADASEGYLLCDETISSCSILPFSALR